MESYDHVILTPYSSARIDLATDMAIPIVAHGGLTSLTPAAVARAAGCTRQAVHHWFGDQQRLREAVAGRFTARWTRWAELRVHDGGPAALLPECDAVLTWTRVWLAPVEAAPRHAAIAELVAGCHVHEGASLQRGIEAVIRLRHDVDVTVLPAVVTGVHAMVNGLRMQLVGAANELDARFGAAEAVLMQGVATSVAQVLGGSCLTSSNGDITE